MTLTEFLDTRLGVLALFAAGLLIAWLLSLFDAACDRNMKIVLKEANDSLKEDKRNRVMEDKRP